MHNNNTTEVPCFGAGQLFTPLLKPPSTFQAPLMASQAPLMASQSPSDATMPRIPPPSMPPPPVPLPDNPTASVPAPPTKRKRKTIRIPRRALPDTADQQTARLERKLAIYRASIEQAGAVELSLDDLLYADNALLRLGKLERKAASIWGRICELKGKSDRIMVMSEVLKNVNCTPYPAINQRIERFFKRNSLDLPDILDVSDMICKVSEKEGLSLGKAEVLRLSKQVLQYVGNLMSDRRRADLYEVLKSRTNGDELAIGPDPLQQDPVYKARLEENDASFKTRLRETLGLYCLKQDAQAANGDTADPVSEAPREDNALCDWDDSPLYSPSFIPIQTPAADGTSDTEAVLTDSLSCITNNTFHCITPLSKESSHLPKTPPVETNLFSTPDTNEFHPSPTSISKKKRTPSPVPKKRIKLDTQCTAPIVISSDED